MARRSMLMAWIVLIIASSTSFAQTGITKRDAAGDALMRGGDANALLAIDQHRATVIDRIVSQWGGLSMPSGTPLDAQQLRAILSRLRADDLLAASLAGTAEGLREVIEHAQTATKAGVIQPKALGDVADDLVYTPVSPCRLFDTRPFQGGLGVMQPNVRRTYGAVTAVANQGGPGGCNAPNGAAVALIQIGTLTPSGNGFLQGGAQGVASFPNALILYQAGDQYGTTVAMPLNVANGQFDVQVQFAPTDLYGDLLGYFKAPSGQYFVQGGNTFGTTAKLGTLDNQALTIVVNNLSALRLIPVTDGINTNTVNVVNGSPINSVVGNAPGATIAGGGATNGGTDYPNHVTGQYGTVSGGVGNTASHDGVVGGGEQNTAGGDITTIAGGAFNATSNIGSTVGGGGGNTASGFDSTVPGGAANVASGDYSFAAGRRAKATTNGTFMWADARDFDFQPSVANFFGVRATGGVGLTVGINPSTGAVTEFCNLLPAVTPSWACTSDRNVKENFVPADGKDILRRLVAMPLSSWNMKNGDPAIRSLGPTAQDFYQAFGLGTNDKTIASLNLEGVALGAIQGLHQVVQEKDARIAALEQEVSSQQRQISELQSLREELTAIKAMVSAMKSARDNASSK